MWVPTVEDLVALHDRILETSGGEPGILNLGALDGAVNRCEAGPYDRVGSLTDRAALLLRGIALDHPFVDGNKRTAYASARLFLERNGARVQASADEVVEFMVQVARDGLEPDSIQEWLEAHVAKS